MILEILSYESNWALHCIDSSALAIHLFPSQLENGIIKKGSKGIAEEFSYWHFLVLIFVLYDFEHLFNHIIVRAWLQSLLKFTITFVHLFDFLYKEIYLLFKKIMTLSFIFFICGFKFNFEEALIRFKKVYKLSFSIFVPFWIGVFLKLELL